MRVLAHVHGYPPHHNAGAEWMLHSILRWLVEQGHECRVIVDRKGMPFDYRYHGVDVVGPDLNQYTWSEVVITHLDLTHYVYRFCQFLHRPLVHLVHNQWQLDYFQINDADLVVFNSEWLAKKVDWQHGPWIVLHPPIRVEDYQVPTDGREHITLINLTVDKGATFFLGFAREMRRRKFLGVKGSYGVQLPVPAPNITYVENGDVRKVYEKTKLLLMPSRYESFGRVAVEAACSGIPTIGHATSGIREALGEDGGVLIEKREDTAAWRDAINCLMEDASVYTARSLAAQRMAREWYDLVYGEELPAFERAVRSVVR